MTVDQRRFVVHLDREGKRTVSGATMCGALQASGYGLITCWDTEKPDTINISVSPNPSDSCKNIYLSRAQLRHLAKELLHWCDNGNAGLTDLEFTL